MLSSRAPPWQFRRADSVPRVQQPSLGANSTVLMLLRATQESRGPPFWRMQLLRPHGSNAFTISRLVMPSQEETRGGVPLTMSTMGGRSSPRVFRAEGGDGSWSEVELSIAPFALRLFTGAQKGMQRGASGGAG